MIGASLDQLDVLSASLSITGTDIAEVGTESNRVVATAVEEMGTSAHTARTLIDSAMAEMVASVDRSRAELGNQDWSGPNRTTFDVHYESFQAIMKNAQIITNDTFATLQGTIARINDEISAYASEIVASMNSASESSLAMANAVKAQRENLDAAMGGMSVG